MRIERNVRAVKGNSGFRGKRTARRMVAVATAAAAVISMSRMAHAAAEVWLGGVNNKLGTTGNWSGTNPIPLTGDSFTFNGPGSAGASLLDDLMTPAAFNLAGITFSASASGTNYVINPNTPGTNGFTLTGNITNNSTSLQTINDAITDAASRTISLTAGGGDLALGGAVNFTAASTITVQDTAGIGGTLTIGNTWSSSTASAITLSANLGTTITINSSGAINDSGGAVVLNDTGGVVNLQSTGALTSTTTTTVNMGRGGVLVASAVNALTGATTFTTSSGNGFIDIQKAQNFTGAMTIDNGSVLRLEDGGAVASTSLVTMAGAGTTLQLRNDTNNTLFTIGTGTGNFWQANSTADIDVNQASTGTNNTLAMTGIRNGGSNIIVTGGHGYSLNTGNVTMTGSGNTTLFPISANVIVPTITNTGATPTFQMDGITTGNTVSGVIGTGTATVAVTKINTGAWSLTGANIYTNATTVNGGTLSITGASGSINTSAATVNVASILQLDNSGAVNGNRLSDTLALTFNNGTLSYIGNASGASTETIGATALNLGWNNISLTGAAGGATAIISSSATRGAGASVTFTGNGLGTSGGTANTTNYVFTTAPTLTGGGTGVGTTTISTLPYAVVVDSGNTGLTSGSLATVDVNGVRALTASEYATGIATSANATDNLLLSGANTQTAAAQSINAMVLASGGGLAQGGNTLTLGAGTILALAGNTGISGGIIKSGAGLELEIINNQSLTIGSTIADSTGGASAVSLSGPGTTLLTAANNYTGNTILNSGSLGIGNASALGTTGTLVMNNQNATVFASGGALSISNPVLLNSGFGVSGIVGGSNNLTFNGTVINGNNSGITINNTGLTTFAGATAINLSPTAATTGQTLRINGSGNILVSGVISNGGTGAGGLNYAGTGTLTLTAANTYTGTTTIGNIENAANNVAAYGPVPGALEGAGTLKLDFSAATAPATNIISGSSVLNMGGSTLTLVGKGSTSNAQTFASTAFGAELNTINLTAGSSGNILLNLGAITKTSGSDDNRSGVLNINLPAGTQSATNGVTTTLANTNGILPQLGGGSVGIVVNGTDFGTNSGGNIVPLPAASYVSASGSTNNVDVTTGTASVSSAWTLHFGAGATPGAVTVNVSGVPALISGGAIMVSSAMGSNNVTIQGGAIDGPNNRGLQFFQFDPSNVLTVNSVLTDQGSSGGMGVMGNGTVVFGGTNLYSGQTFISGATLSIGSNVNLGSQTTGAAIDLDGGTLQATGTFGLNNGAAGNSDRNIGLSARGGTIDVTGTNNLTVSGYISGIGGLTKTSSGGGSGTLTIAGRAFYTGPTNVNGGQLTLTGTGSLGNTAVAVNGGATLNVTGSSSIGFAGPAAAGTLTLAGGSTISTVGTLNMMDNAIETLSINGTSLASALTLGSAANPSALDFDVNLANSSSDQIALSSTSLLQLNAGGAKINIDGLNSFSGTKTYNLITFGPNKNIGTGVFTLGTTGGLAASLSFLPASGVLQLTVTGSSPTDAYWTGAQSQTWSTLSSGNSNWSSDPAGANDIHQLPVDGTTVHFVSGASTANPNPNVMTLGADFAIKGMVFNSTATGPITIGGANTLTLGSNGIVIDSGSGSHKITTTGSGGNPGLLLGNPQAWANNSGNVFEIDSVIGGTATNGLTISGTGSGGFFLNPASANLYSGGTTINSGGKLKIGQAGALGSGPIAVNGMLDLNDITTSTLGVLTGTTGTITNTATGTATLTTGTGTFSGSITDAGSSIVALHVAGPGTFAVTGAQTYHGVTTIDPGATLQLGDGLTANSSIVNSTIMNNGTLGFGVPAASPTSYTANLTGIGAVSKTGGGVLTLGNASTVNSYQGGTTISNGTLKLGNVTALGVGAVSVAGGTLDLNGFSPTYSAGLSGSGAIDNSAGGNVILTVNTPGATSTGYAGNIRNTTGTLQLVKQGTGSFTVSGSTSSYTGGTDVQNGTLILGSGGANPFGATGSAVTVESGAAFVIPDSVSNQTWNYALTLNGTGINNHGALEFTGASGRLGFGGTGAGSPPPLGAGASIGVADGAAIGADGGTAAAPNLIGPISGGGPTGWTKVGTGLLQLEGGNPNIGNTYTGPLTIAAGAIRSSRLAGSNNSIPGALVINSGGTYSNGQPEQISDTSIVTVNGGIFDLDTNGITTQFNETIGGLAGSATGTVYESFNLAVNGSTTFANYANLNINAASGNNFSGVIADGNGELFVSLTAANTGTQILSGNNTYTGNTTINGGKLVINGAIADSGASLGPILPNFTGNNSVFVGGGTAVAAASPTLGGIGTVNPQTIVNGPGTGGATTAGHIAPGSSGVLLGTLTIANTLTLAANSDADFTLGTPGTSTPGSSSMVAVSSTLSVPSGAGNSVVVNLFDNANAGGSGGAIGNGLYRLFTFGGVSGFDAATSFTIGTSPFASATYTFSDPGSEIDLLIQNAILGGPQNLTWSGGSAAWDVSTTANWNGNTLKFNQGDNVTFDDSNTGSLTVTTGATTVTPASVVVSSSKAYVFNGSGGIGGTTGLTQSSGGSLTIQNTNAYTGATSVSGTGTTLAVTSTGKLATQSLTVGSGSIANITGLLTNAPAVTINGTLNLGANAMDGTNGSAGSILVRSWGALNVTGTLSVAATTAANHTSRTVLVTTGLTNTGKIDLANNDLIVKGVSASTLFTQLKNGFNAHTGYWDGASGIVSSSAHSDTRFLTTLGYGQSQGGTFDTVSTTTADALVKYTYYGDANLDGVVNGADYQQIDLGFGSGGTDWSHGDFNYDGVVNGSDFALIDNTFNQLTATGATGLAIVASPASVIASPSVTSAVPEPTTLGLLGIGAASLLGRRKRKTCKACD